MSIFSSLVATVVSSLSKVRIDLSVNKQLFLSNKLIIASLKLVSYIAYHYLRISSCLITLIQYSKDSPVIQLSSNLTIVYSWNFSRSLAKENRTYRAS